MVWTLMFSLRPVAIKHLVGGKRPVSRNPRFKAYCGQDLRRFGIRTRMPRRILSLIAATQLALLPSALFAEPKATGSDIAGLIEIGGGRKLYLECKGTGSPVVILEAGLRNRADIWSVKPDVGAAVFPRSPPSPGSAHTTVPERRSAPTSSAAAIQCRSREPPRMPLPTCMHCSEPRQSLRLTCSRHIRPEG